MKVKVMIVGEACVAFERIAHCLRLLDLSVMCVESGRGALEMVAEHDLAFVLVGKDLSDMSGIELSRLVHSDSEKRHIPIVLLATAEESQIILYRAIEAGVSDFLYLPFQRGLVAAKARLYLDMHASRQRVLQQNEALAASNRALSEFAHAASHDLRAPLRAVKGFAQLLQEGDGDEAFRQDYVGRILDAAQRMERMLEAVLRFADSGHKAIAKESVDLEATMEQVRANLDSLIRESGALLEYGALPTLTGDADELVRLFQNIVGNAIKYRRADVPLRVRISAEIDEERVRLEITDNGRGFDNALAEELFRPFRRLVTSREVEGSGIGMATAKKIVEAHGGAIHARGRPGEGATFTVELPVLAAEAAAFARRQRACALTREREEAMRVLVVDDDAYDLDCAVSALSSPHVATFEDAESALEGLVDADVVLTDYNLPGRDGIWLLSQVAERRGDTLRVLMSGAPDANCEEALRAGIADAVLTKPLHGDVLSARLRELRAGQPARAE